MATLERVLSYICFHTLRKQIPVRLFFRVKIISYIYYMFNNSHYFEVFKRHPRKELYCPPLGVWLGENGLYEGHWLKGSTVTKKRSKVPYVITDVYVHYWNGGYYWLALVDDPRGSTSQITWNINNPEPGVIENVHLWNFDITKTNM